jgi:hypothetical protein
MSMLNPLPPKRNTKANMSALNFNTKTKIGKCLGIFLKFDLGIIKSILHLYSMPLFQR